MSMTLNCIQWMPNQEGQDPCTVAQEVGQLCNPEYTVSLTNFEESHYIPSTTTANGCTCSWSIYNLLSACSYCVGQYQYTSWTTWLTNCGSYASNTSYLPSGLNISYGIPFWAATDPSTWYEETFNITQAANEAAQAQPDVTGGPLPTSTVVASSSVISTGSVVGLAIGCVAIVIISGGLFILFAAYRRRREKTHQTTPINVSSFNASRSLAVPTLGNQLPIPFGYTPTLPASIPHHISPAQSMTSLAPTSFIPPGSFPASGYNGLPVTDAANVISPFLATSSNHQTNRAHASPSSKATEALSERVMAPPGQRARLNPPPYSAPVETGSSESAINWARRRSTRKEKRRRSSLSMVMTYSQNSRPSTRESATTANAGARAEQSPPPIAPEGIGMAKSVSSGQGTCDVGGRDGGDGDADSGGRKGVTDQRPPT